MSKRRDRTGEVYGQLTILRLHSISQSSASMWECLCTCGKIAVVRDTSLVNGHTKSCGCLQIEAAKKANTTHGATLGRKRTLTHIKWDGVIQRCRNVNNSRYHDYGGKGITVCERWLKFENFLADMGECPPGLEIDRWPNNQGNYEPGNCRWATEEEQDNNRTNNVMWTHEGKTLSMAQWERERRVPKGAFKYRHEAKWPVPKILDTPFQVQNKPQP